MQGQYYININGQKDGPHDLVTIMRRIRIGKIGANTEIFTEITAQPMQARLIPEIASFFEQRTLPSNKKSGSNAPELSDLIKNGWAFTLEHNIMTVYAGCLLLVSIMLLIGLVDLCGAVVGGLVSWCIFFVLHNIYLVFALRVYRGQRIGNDFINQFVTPLMPRLIGLSLMLALLTGSGWFVTSLFPEIFPPLLAMLITIIPCTICAVLFMFSPLLILDNDCSVLAAMHGSRKLLLSHGQPYVWLITIWIMLHLLCITLIIPLPLTLPLFASAFSEIYEKISAG